MARPLLKHELESDAKTRRPERRTTPRPPSAGSAVSYLWPPAVALAVLAMAWEIWTHLANVPVYIVPAPLMVVERLFGDIGYFARHGAITLLEALAGFSLGAAVAIVAATLMAHSQLLERTMFPLAVLVKVTPVVAVAPLLVIWIGFGYLPKVVIAALITFFPVLVNALTGLRSINPGTLDLFRSLNASKREVLIHLRVPSSLPYLFAASRIAVPLSVIGAVVAEFFSADRGLGSVIFVAHHNLDMPTSFSAILVLAFIGISLTILTTYIERRVLFWHESFMSS